MIKVRGYALIRLYYNAHYNIASHNRLCCHSQITTTPAFLV